MSGLTSERLRSIAAAAVAAPSADNHHQFLLEASEDRLDLVAAPAMLNAPLGRRILGMISVGAVVENMVLRAARLGLRLEVDWSVAPTFGPLLARIKCHEAAPAADPLERAIEHRHSNRRLRFRGPALPADVQASMSELARGIEGSSVVWLDAREPRSRALRLVRLAETQRFCVEQLHRELFESIRFDAGWADTVAQGLPPATLALSAVERTGFTMLRNWKTQRAANLIGVHWIMAMRAADLPCRLSPHLCAIAAEGEVESGALRAGRLMQRLWLHATNRQLAFQVFAASALYALDDFAPVSPRIRSELISGWTQLCPVGRPYLVFRMGHARPPSIRAGRPPPEDFLR